MKSRTKICQNCKQSFTLEPEDFQFYEKIKVPLPTFCSYCRMLRRLASLNHRSLYKRNCSKCGKSIPSMYAPESLFTVYCTECYFSDEWDASKYNAHYDFSKPFFPQFYELIKKAPQLHIEHQNNNGGNIVFSNYVYRSKNMYLSYGIVRGENIYYSWGAENGNRNCFDSLNFSKNENCYDVVSSNGNYNCSFLTRSDACIDSHFLFDCSNCTNCFMSSNLRNKSNVFYNEQLSKEEYNKKIKEFWNGCYTIQEKCKKDYDRLMLEAIHRYATILQSEYCTGDFIFNSKNVLYSFAIQGGQNLKFGVTTTNLATDCMDFNMAGRADNSYEFAVAGRGNSSDKFCYNIGETQNLEYCDSCNSTKDCFGCVGLKNKQYCIFNIQYSKEEYFKLKDQIIKQMNDLPYVDEKGRIYKYGEYFPMNFSRFAYNECAAFEFYPIPKEDIFTQGYMFREGKKKSNIPTLKVPNIPDTISEISLDILNQAIECAHKSTCNHICTNAFRITKEELEFYKKLHIALPRLCPNCRYFERLSSRMLPWRLWDRRCACQNKKHLHHNGQTCVVQFQTSYAPDRPQKVYCEKCYLLEIY